MIDLTSMAAAGRRPQEQDERSDGGAVTPAELRRVLMDNSLDESVVRVDGGFAYQTLCVGPLQCNCTIIADLEAKEALVVDPGGDVRRIIEAAQALGVEIRHAYHTHGHFDHILGSADLKKATSATLHLHAKDAFWWNGLERQVRGWRLELQPTFAPCDDLFSGEHAIRVGRIEGRALFTPGHTAGSCSFHFPQLGIVCTGDTLFKLNVGRTDLIDGDFAALERSIRGTLYALSEHTKVIPGHGPCTLIALEKRMNVLPALTDSTDRAGDSTPARLRDGAPAVAAHPCAACDRLCSVRL